MFSKDRISTARSERLPGIAVADGQSCRRRELGKANEQQWLCDIR